MSLNPRLRRPQFNFNTRKLKIPVLNYITNNYTSSKRSKQSKQRKQRRKIRRDIKNFTKRLSLKKYTKFRQAGGNNIECAICLEDDFSTNPYSWVKLPCEHDFHLSCIIEWVMGRNPVCPICRIKLNDDLCDALVDRKIDVNSALFQNTNPPRIRHPLRLPVANQRVNQSASLERLPPHTNQETMSFNDIRSRERQPITFFIHPPVTQQHEPRLLNIANPGEWALLSSTTPIAQQPQLRVLSPSNREDMVFLSRILQTNPTNFIRRYRRPLPRVTVNI